MINLANSKYSIIDCIENELKKPLPGIESQFRMAPESRLRAVIPDSAQSKKSGVLLLLYFKKNELNIVFIKRSINESVHSGQISFPGGKFDKEDKDLKITALRETHEEIGVRPDEIQIIGTLTTLFIPVSNYIVYPFIGFCNQMPEFKLNASEVAGIIEIPLVHFLDINNHKLSFVEVRGMRYEVPVFEISENKIWGATAMIMNEFVDLLKNIKNQF